MVSVIAALSNPKKSRERPDDRAFQQVAIQGVVLIPVGLFGRMNFHGLDLIGLRGDSDYPCFHG